MNNNLNKSLMGLALTVVLLSSVNANAANSKVASLPLSAERVGLQLQQYQAQGAGPLAQPLDKHCGYSRVKIAAVPAATPPK